MNKYIKFILMMTLCIPGTAFCQYQRSLPNEQRYLSVTPDLKKTSLNDGYVKIPFIVKNITPQDIRVLQYYNMIRLTTRDDSGKRISLKQLQNPNAKSLFSGAILQVVLKPGESRTYEAIAPLDALAFAAGKHKKISGEIIAYIAASSQEFESYSDPFPIPAALSTPPWVDLGEQRYFSVDPDLLHMSFPDGIMGGAILFPVNIKNVGSGRYVAATNSVSFFLARDAKTRVPPSLWEVSTATVPVLAPGESATSTGRCYITFDYLRSKGYKQGDKIIAATGGRIPSTNQVFECYSEPFELPPLPESPSAPHP